MEAVINAAPLLLQGFALTVSVAVLSLLLATLLGALGAAAKISGGAPKAAAGIYTTIIRGVPDLVTMLIIYFGGQRLVNAIARGMGMEGVEISTFAAGVIAIGFVYGAYLTETFRGAYLAVPVGQIEAARAYGFSRAHTLRRVTAPQLLRFALPGYANVWQVLAKATALVSVIGLNDLVGLATRIGRRERDPFTFLLVVMIAYLLMTAISEFGFRRLRRHLERGT